MLDKNEVICYHVTTLNDIIANSSNQRDNRAVRFGGY